MIQNLEGERRRIDEALEVLRRLHRAKKPTPAPATDSPEGEHQLMKKVDAEEEK